MSEEIDLLWNNVLHDLFQIVGGVARKVCKGFGECRFEFLVAVFKPVYYIVRSRERFNLGEII